MGLDMYLTGKRYISEYSEEDKPIIEAIKTLNIAGVSSFNANEISVRLGYWRKANQIHKWFVDNVQEGIDKCQEHYVTIDQLIELLALVEQVLADETLADKLLPVQNGFFFGSDAYDEYYFGNLEATVPMLKAAIATKGTGIDIYYQSSW